MSPRPRKLPRNLPRCDCGQLATRRVLVPGLCADLLHPRPITLELCPRCYRLELSMGEPILADEAIEGLNAQRRRN